MDTGDPVTLSTVELASLHWQDIRSSNVQQIAYQPGEPTTKPGRLYVRFRNSGLYRYDDVPGGDHAALIEANADTEASVGKLLNETVKTTRTCHRIEVLDP